MSLGIVMLVHTALRRAEQVARHWAAAGCPVVIHCDSKVRSKAYARFREALSDVPDLRFAPRHRCEWGTWGLVAATQGACEIMLRDFPQADHVYLTSGACLPLRPVSELIDYLASRGQTDFIESATTADVPWTIGGLSDERFTLRFPFAWHRRRRAFDAYVRMQRAVKFRRRIPAGISPHMGSQWWCLRRETLQGILEDPRRPVFDRYFRKVWIPDESYFQTLARLHSRDIESRSLTLSKFDHQGRPHIFYDDHLQLLRKSDCFVARKIWPRANRLYKAFLTDEAGAMKRTEPNPDKIDRLFSRAEHRRTRGRPGLYMQSRFPREGWEHGLTGTRYSVLQGYDALFAKFPDWLSRAAGVPVHGQLFGPGDAEFAGGNTMITGALSNSAVLRDCDPRAFLTNLSWNTRGERQCFQFAPGANQKIAWDLAKDPNARVHVISGAWAVPLFLRGGDFDAIRREAARLQKAESDFLHALQSPFARGPKKICTLAEFVESPAEWLQAIVAELAGNPRTTLGAMPLMPDLTGFPEFLQKLKNQGMHPYLTGNFPVQMQPGSPPSRRRSYQVQK